jgi:hypothetical protein
MGNPLMGVMDKDDDEACEIDSEGSVETENNSQLNILSNRNRRNQKLEESIRSSRTATFKSVIGTI